METFRLSCAAHSQSVVAVQCWCRGAFDNRCANACDAALNTKRLSRVITRRSMHGFGAKAQRGGFETTVPCTQYTGHGSSPMTSTQSEEFLAPGRYPTDRYTPRSALLRPWLCTLDCAGNVCVAGCAAKFSRASVGEDSLHDVLRGRVCDHVADLRAAKAHTHPALSRVYQAKEGRGARKASLVERAQDAFAETVGGLSQRGCARAMRGTKPKQTFPNAWLLLQAHVWHALVSLDTAAMSVWVYDPASRCVVVVNATAGRHPPLLCCSNHGAACYRMGCSPLLSHADVGMPQGCEVIATTFAPRTELSHLSLMVCLCGCEAVKLSGMGRPRFGALGFGVHDAVPAWLPAPEICSSAWREWRRPHWLSCRESHVRNQTHADGRHCDGNDRGTSQSDCMCSTLAWVVACYRVAVLNLWHASVERGKVLADGCLPISMVAFCCT